MLATNADGWSLQEWMWMMHLTMALAWTVEIF
jgi:hypothetical protein